MRWLKDFSGSWAGMAGILMFLNGIQLVCVGVLGEYIGKIYLETKGRPRYIIRERTAFIPNEEIRQELTAAAKRKKWDKR